ncbi:hypothetical protein AMATHDRAFT_55280 [Amanita thiersii Skay4041]|uniref:F-box domain-containing protein n=1 Tax=Amanita thiersii Skay4041 TaxID=703135 RepID=A0A2A9NZF1_9AGAR|nr:hypothetical protein AMATHDRAFT_55280 [Amanita thiersii Skay4041]
MSFDRLLFEKSYVAELVRHLWISPPSEEDYFPSFRIVSQCTNIRTLGCNVRLLYTAVLNEKMLKHMQCRSLTIIGPDSRRWEGAKCGGVFFHHLTHLRISGDMIPETLQFERLTHLSYMNKNAIATMQAASSVLEDATRYPVLEIVVVTQETSCTGNGTSYARLICPRLILYQHARALPEVETWCDGIRGMTIWDKAKEEVRSVRRR